ncbi:MAG: hypothetical protein PHO08_07340 [Methylococcales bacterium]|nr:hypothetical protein [Methylococcales bacterium]
MKTRNVLSMETNCCNFISNFIPADQPDNRRSLYHMRFKRLFLICSLSTFLAGCSEFYGSQPPAPVYGSGSTVYAKTTPSLPKPKTPEPIKTEPLIQGTSETVETKPLKEFNQKTAPIEELKPESESITPEQKEQNSLASEQGALTSEQGSIASGKDEAKPSPSQEPVVSEPMQEIMAPPPPPPPPPFVPLETFAPLSPAVSALALAANQSSKSGDVESATTTIERAIRIEPRNATLYYKLALLRLKESKPRLAEDLAKKAALLASDDTQLKKHSWLLVARAREMQGDLKGGKEARAKADQF